MLVAVVADSHDNQVTLRSAVALCRAAGVAAILHCGDIIAPFSMRLLVASGIPVYAVYGNNDGERRMLQKELPTITEPPLELTLGGRKIVLYHAPPQQFPKSDAVFYGHTHKREQRFQNGTFILNPGELGGWVTGKASMALVDLRTFEVEWFEF